MGISIDKRIIETEQISLLFITVAGNAIGYGHLSRCLSLAEHAAKRNLSVSFLLFGDNDAFSRVKHAGFDCLLKPISALGSRFADTLLNHVDMIDVVVMDFSHQDVFPDLECAHQILKDIRSRARKIIVIDALGVQALATKMPDMPIDILVVPYVGATLPDNAPWQILEGPAYAVLSSAYAELHERIVRQDADRILVSCGGSDPKKLTALVLDGIGRISKTLKVRVIVGPLFDECIRAILKSAVSKSKHSIELVDSPTALAEHMMWCDLAIATTGLIKYELAATGTPGILISIDDIHDLINRPFANMGSALDLGVRAAPQLIADHVASLLDNHEARAAMAKFGRQMIDGKGTERLVAEIIKSCNVAQSLARQNFIDNK